jgi:flagellar basal-body rod protein FlgC
MNDLFRAFNISASGMYAQRVRMNVVASNLANYESYRANGEPFRKLEVVFQALEDPKNLSKGEVPVRVGGGLCEGEYWYTRKVYILKGGG